jgi:hypothetical protein
VRRIEATEFSFSLADIPQYEDFNFNLIMAVSMNSTVFRVVTPCTSEREPEDPEDISFSVSSLLPQVSFLTFSLNLRAVFRLIMQISFVAYS